MSGDLEPDRGGPWTSKGFLAAAGVLGVIVALAVMLVVSNVIGGGPDATTADGDGVAPEQTDQAPAGNSDSVCGLPDAAMTGTVDQPPAAEWTLLGTIAVPKAERIGPGVVEDNGFRYCYARTPQGALFMAANTAGIGATRLLDKRFAEYAVAAGPGRDAAIADAAGGPSSAGDGGGIRLQIAGFRILSYTGTAASVDLAFRVSTGATMVQAFDLVWEDGDWKVRLTDEGELPSEMAQVPDLTGYIPWGGA